MLPLHHLTHAVCIVIISFLLKKYIELRSAHGHLTLELQQLKLACHSPESPSLSHTPPQPCPCQIHPLHQKISLTDIKTDFQTSSEQEGPPSLEIGSQTYPHVSRSGNDVVDEFGRTSDYRGDGRYAGVVIESSISSTHSQSLPLHHHAMHPSTSVSDTVPQLGRSWESARQQVGGWTESDFKTSVSFQGTSESLEKIRPSPSTAAGYSVAQSSISAKQIKDAEAGDDDNDFYQGSRFRHSEEEEVDVIVTSVTNNFNKDFSPHSVDLSDQLFDGYDQEDYEWEEETDEEEPHPAFGNVELEWLTEQEKEEMSAEGSSVQCSGHSLSDRMCRFRQLCFQPETQQFVFFLSPSSVQDNPPPQPSQQALLEMSTVAGHNAQLFSYHTLPASALPDFHVASIKGLTVVFKRFKPDNIMHVFHDDIFPLFHTLTSLNIRPDAEGRSFPVSLFLADENSEGEFYDLYDVFAAHGTFTSGSLTASVTKSGKANSLVCFSDAHVGLAKTTTWYQYGFFTPQGPIPNSQVQSHHIHSVTSFLLDRFAKECELCGERGHLVLILRKETRRILNEMELVLAISKEFRVKVMTVSLETHDLADILPIIHSSLGIVGMHGSLLALATFLKQGSVVIELFPYAVRPEHYRPYATLSSIPGLFVAYRAWVNLDDDQSVPHPDWSADFGGIQHLPLQQQQEIMSQREVPPHLCCEDPSWLYHIFQDTHVNIPQVLSLLSSALQESASFRAVTRPHPHPHPRPHHPGPPQKLQCTVEHSEGGTALVLEWAQPWDAPVGLGRKMGYSIVLQETESGREREVMEVGDILKVKLREGVKDEVEYRVWVRSGVEGVYGPFAAVSHCSTHRK